MSKLYETTAMDKTEKCSAASLEIWRRVVDDKLV
jgi:hypothetical protein